MKQTIHTVLGEIAPENLGWCQCHEHLFLEKGKSYEVNPALCQDDAEKSTRELARYKAAGGDAYVDAQPGGCGRMAEEMVAASGKTGVHIVASTGFHKLCFFENGSPYLKMDEEELADLYTSEITQGMRASVRAGGQVLPAKAGIIKVAVDTGGIKGSAAYERLFGAALHAAKQTGAALLAHFEADTDAFELLKLMEGAGLPPQKLLACHLDRARYDAGYHEEVAQAGAFLEYDTIHRPKNHDDEAEIDLIENMVEKGYEKSLLLSLDTTSKRLKEYGGDMGLDYLLTTFRQKLAARGIGEELLRRFMVDNAARALAF